MTLLLLLEKKITQFFLDLITKFNGYILNFIIIVVDCNKGNNVTKKNINQQHFVFRPLLKFESN
jgi:hypothetical protein